jgi:hypothetical protein
MLAVTPATNATAMNTATTMPPTTAPQTVAIIRSIAAETERACRQMAPRNTMENAATTAPHSDQLI